MLAMDVADPGGRVRCVSPSWGIRCNQAVRVRRMCLRHGVPGEGELGEKLARGVLHHILHGEMDGGLGLRKTQSRYIGGEAIQHVDGSGDNPLGVAGKVDVGSGVGVFLPVVHRWRLDDRHDRPVLARFLRVHVMSWQRPRRDDPLYAAEGMHRWVSVGWENDPTRRQLQPARASTLLHNNRYIWRWRRCPNVVLLGCAMPDLAGPPADCVGNLGGEGLGDDVIPAERGGRGGGGDGGRSGVPRMRDECRSVGVDLPRDPCMHKCAEGGMPPLIVAWRVLVLLLLR